MTQTMLLTWVILGTGGVLIALAAPRVLSRFRERANRQGGPSGA